MSEKTEPTSGDIIIRGFKKTGEIYATFHQGENLKDFQDFRRSLQLKNINELTSHLESFYEKEDDWFMNKFINNGVCCALDAVSFELPGRQYNEIYPEDHLFTAVAGCLIWCAYLAQVTGSKEVPEIYHAIDNNSFADLGWSPVIERDIQ